MSKRLTRLLDEPEPHISKLIAELETKNGYPSHDARLLAEVTQKTRSKLVDLNLDPDDTTGEELYEALLAKFKRDARLFDEYFGATGFNFEEKVAKAAKLLESAAKDTRQWGLKNKAAKDALRRLPPKRLMKHLNYRSVESLLKRENLAEIYLAASYLESDYWLKNHKKLISKFDQTELEIKNVSIVSLSHDKWASLDGPANFVAQSEEIAGLGIWPSRTTQKAPLLSIVLLLADSLSQFTDLKAAKTAAHLNGIVAWWADMDHLITDLYDGPISLNLKDVAANHTLSHQFGKGQLSHARAAFWQELVSRYDNLPDIDGLFDESVRQKITGFKLSAPEPVYEFAEEFNG